MPIQDFADAVAIGSQEGCQPQRPLSESLEIGGLTLDSRGFVRSVDVRGSLEDDNEEQEDETMDDH